MVRLGPVAERIALQLRTPGDSLLDSSREFWPRGSSAANAG